ncbi:hypothetical protein Trydic_g13835 [Trypoxylus dichotomus]
MDSWKGIYESLLIEDINKFREADYTNELVNQVVREVTVKEVIEVMQTMKYNKATGSGDKLLWNLFNSDISHELSTYGHSSNRYETSFRQESMRVLNLFAASTPHSSRNDVGRGVPRQAEQGFLRENPHHRKHSTEDSDHA